MSTQTATRPGFRLTTRTRKLVLLVHIAAAGSWLGMDLVLGLLVLAAFGSDPVVSASALVGIGEFATWPLTLVGLTTLATGVLLGLGSKYGLVRYWWVAVKLVLNLVLVVLVSAVLGPETGGLAEDARGVLAGDGVLPLLSNLAFPPIVSSAAVLFAMTLSVFKPWGRVGGRA